MIGVFGGFILGADAFIKSIGFAFAVAVFFDAFVVRMTIVPAVLVLLARARLVAAPLAGPGAPGRGRGGVEPRAPGRRPRGDARRGDRHGVTNGDGATTLRVDAERNRVRIIEAAPAAFAEQGLDVSLEAVTERAGVRIATLYRRFPRRDDLIAACFEHRLAEYARAAEEALEADDAWAGFAGYVDRICEMQSADRGLKDVLTRAFPDARTLEAHRRRGYDLLVRLIQRAQAHGSLRQDAVPEDVVLLMMANGGVIQGTGEAAPEAWRRFVGLMLDGLRSDGATTDTSADESGDHVDRRYVTMTTVANATSATARGRRRSGRGSSGPASARRRRGAGDRADRERRFPIALGRPAVIEHEEVHETASARRRRVAPGRTASAAPIRLAPGRCRRREAPRHRCSPDLLSVRIGCFDTRLQP